MTRDEARTLLGVSAEATADEIRAAFRGLVRRLHPDVAGASGDLATREVITAYRLLQHAPPEPVAPPPSPPQSKVVHLAAAGVEVADDVVTVGLPAAEAFFVLAEVGHDLGEVAYADRSIGLLETIVTFLEWPVCSVVLWLRSRGRSVTEARCTIESLSGAPPPPASAVAELVAERLRVRLAAEGDRGRRA